MIFHMLSRIFRSPNVRTLTVSVIFVDDQSSLLQGNEYQIGWDAGPHPGVTNEALGSSVNNLGGNWNSGGEGASEHIGEISGNDKNNKKLHIFNKSMENNLYGKKSR